MTLELLQTSIVEELPIDDIKKSLREVRIVEKPDALPYLDSSIELEEISLSDLQPVALYVIRRGLTRQLEIRQDLIKLGHDTLHLDSALEINRDDTSARLIPPIVEETEEGLCLMDGLHRAMVARMLGETTLRVLHISNIDPDYPLTSYPNTWDEVVAYDETPLDRSLKKRYRPDQHYFRDLSKVNGSVRREGGHVN